MKFLSFGCIICFSISLFLLVFDSTEGTDCRVVDFYPLTSGKRLENHVIHNKQANSEDFCQVLCYMDNNCSSINFKQTKENDGTHLCELNNSTAKKYPEDLKKHDEFSYRETKDPCANNPCEGNKICISDSGPAGYRCVCPAGSIGDSCEKVKSCNEVAEKGIQVDGSYELALNGSAMFKVYCDMTDDNKAWTLIARFSNNDDKNWMKDSGEYWYDRKSAVGQTTNPADNTDMISPAFWSVNGTEFKITRSDDSTHTALLHTTGECLGGQTFRCKITSYGDFRNSTVWANDKCLGSCDVQYGGQYKTTEGFVNAECDGQILQRNKIGFWCDHSDGDGAVLTIGGAGTVGNCKRTDHGIGVTDADEASFEHDRHGDVYIYESEYDFGNDANNSPPPSRSYSLNVWIQ